MTKLKLNIVDKAIAVFSPGAALSRAQTRARLETATGTRKYDAATPGRRADGWIATGASVNLENMEAIRRLRERSRELTRNNSYAKKGIQVIANNTVGTGIVPAIKAAGRYEKQIKSLWKEWANGVCCDHDGLKTFYGIQHIAIKAVAESGEVIIVRRRDTDKSLPLPLQIQVLESDYLDPWKTQFDLPEGGWIMQGVEFDKKGKRVAYWLFERHPGEYNTTASRRVPSTDVIHLFSEERPGQVRGVPFAVSGMMKMKDLGDYDDAQLVRQKIAACFAGFVTDSANPDLNDDDTYEELSHIEPGTIEYLPEGKKVEFSTPPAAEGYEGYTRKVVQQVAAAFGTSYEAISNDLSNVNFSSGRMGWLEFHRNVVQWQDNILIPLLCTKVWGWFLEAGVMIGKFPANTNPDVNWTPPRRDMIDPVKEVNGLKAMIRAGLISWSEAVRQQGYDPDEVRDEIAKDNKAFDALGIVLESDARYVMQAVKVADGGGDGADASGDVASTSKKKAKKKDKNL